MSRIDKTESAIGVTRGTWAADVDPADYDKVIGVGIDAQGNVVKGAGQTGIIGVCIPTKVARKAGDRCDIFGNGSEVVEVPGLAAGTKYYATAAGELGIVAADTYVGYTVEADRLVVVL